MKKAITIFLFLCPVICSAQVDHVSNYLIGKTTVDAFYRLSRYSESRDNVITSESGYESIWVKLYFDTAYHETKVYAMKFDAGNIQNYGWKLNAPTNPRTKIFYITQLQQQGYVANNVLLTFYKDVLTKIEFDLPAGMFASFSAFQKAGDSSTETKTTSACTQTKNYNISRTITLYDRQNRTQSSLEYIEGMDAACKPYSHFNIKIIDQRHFQEYVTDANNSLPPSHVQPTDKELNEMLKKLKQEEKKSKKST